MRALWLTLALLPYLCAAGRDAWMHERDRQVPGVERWLHNGLALCLLSYFAAVFAGRQGLAMLALLLFLPLHLADALGFHRQLDPAEGRVHTVANLALAAFVGYWLWLDRPWTQI